MRLYEELFKDADGAALCRSIIVPNGGGYFEGVKGVEDFSETCVVVCFPKFRAVIEGEGLFIKKYCLGDLELAGKIFSFYLSDEKGEPLFRRKQQLQENQI